MTPNDIDIPSGVRFEGAVNRCVRLKVGNHAELRDLDRIMRRVSGEDEMGKVGTMARLLVKHDDVPAFHKAQTFADLSSCVGEDGLANIRLAQNWVQEARRLQKLTASVSEDLEEPQSLAKILQYNLQVFKCHW